MARQGEKIPVNPKNEKEEQGSEKVQSEVDVHESFSSGIEGGEIDLNGEGTVAGHIGATDSSLFPSQPDGQKYNGYKDWQVKHFPHCAEKFFAGESSQNQVDEQSNVLAVVPHQLSHPTSFGESCSDKEFYHGFRSDDLDCSASEKDGLDMDVEVIERNIQTRKSLLIIDENRQECSNSENAVRCISPVSLGQGDPVTKKLDNEKKILSVPKIYTKSGGILISGLSGSERAQKRKSVMDDVENCLNILKNEPSLGLLTEPDTTDDDDVLESLGSRIRTILNAKQCGDDETTPIEPGALTSQKNKHIETKHKLPEDQPKQKTPKENFFDDTDRYKEIRNDEDEKKIPGTNENIGIDGNGQRKADFTQQHIKEPDKHTKEAIHNPNLLITHNPTDNREEEFIPKTADSAQHQTDEPDNEDILSNEPNIEFSMIYDSIENVAEDNISETADVAQQHSKEPDKEILSNEPEHYPELLKTDIPIDNIAEDLIDDRAEDTIPGSTDDLSKTADDFREESQSVDFVDGLENSLEKLLESTAEFCEEKLSNDLPTVEDVAHGMENTPDKFPASIPDNEESYLQENMAVICQSLEIKNPDTEKQSDEEDDMDACDATLGDNDGDDPDSSDDDNTDIEDSDDEITSLKRLFKKSKDFSSDDETVETEAELIKQKADGKLFTPPTSDVVVPNYQGIYDSRTTYNQSLESFLHNRNVRENPRIPIDDLARNRYILTGDNATCMGCNTRHSIRDIEGRPSRNIVWHQDNCPFANRRRPCADCSSTFVEDDGLEYCTQCRQPIRRIRATSDLLAHLPQNLEPPDPSGRTFNSCVICHRDIQYRQNQDVCVVCGGRICRRCVRREERHFH